MRIAGQEIEIRKKSDGIAAYLSSSHMVPPIQSTPDIKFLLSNFFSTLMAYHCAILLYYGGGESWTVAI